MRCDLQKIDGRLVCPVCGFSMRDRGRKVVRECGTIRGVGDLVSIITEATGIKAAVDAVAGEDCGCKGRRQKLNELFPL